MGTACMGTKATQHVKQTGHLVGLPAQCLTWARPRPHAAGASAEVSSQPEKYGGFLL